MSIICCRIDKEEITIASDSITVRDWTQEKGKDKFAKLAEINGMIIGGAGIAEETCLLQIFCQTRKPEAATEQGILIFLSEFAAWKKNKTEKYKIDNSYIILFDGKAFYTCDFFVKEISCYEATGAGMDYALSALYLGHDVVKAVETACELSIYCEKPVIKMSMRR